MSNRPTTVWLARAQDLDDAALRALAGPVALDAHDHPVAVHRLLAVRRRDEHVRRRGPRGARRRTTNADPAGDRLEAADHEVHLLGHAVPPAADLDQRPVGDQRL